ncbi:hypothetical protein BJ978_000681 [Agromyces terreus]|uniref:Transcriptional regulator, AbiEi antitoxin, Type IV TA system n=1 Tax=Agromyces terreus TaxID=424795 RepID=A0A9X2GVV7_9MICO|nr:hypothetical protein [Agromyces terreus]MCP2370005.1 hypothetical protein [Agromyces terreus]
MTTNLPVNEHGFVLARSARTAGRLAELRSEYERGDLRRVRQGVYVPVDRAAPTSPKWRRDAAEYVLRVRAVAETRLNPVFTGYSAIALAGLPIVRAWPDDVFVLSPTGVGHRRGGVREVARAQEVGTTIEGGLAVTSIEYSLLQLCRYAPLGAALCAVDAALHTPRSGSRHPLTTLDLLRGEHERIKPYPGSAKADAVLARATVHAESPLETCSRLVIEELGYPEPVLQKRFWLPDSAKHAIVDFWWPDHGVGAEADGHGKYGLGATASDAVEAVVGEKLREDELRHQLRGFARWDWDDMWKKRVLDARLIRAGLPKVRRPRTLL